MTRCRHRNSNCFGDDLRDYQRLTDYQTLRHSLRGPGDSYAPANSNSVEASRRFKSTFLSRLRPKAPEERTSRMLSAKINDDASTVGVKPRRAQPDSLNHSTSGTVHCDCET